MRRREKGNTIGLGSLRAAVGGVLVIGIITRILGLVREVLVAQSFGTGPELDGILLGLAVPSAFMLGIGGGLSRAFVPLVAGAGEREAGGIFRAAISIVRKKSVIAGLAAAFVALVTLPFLVPPGISAAPVYLAALAGALVLTGSAIGGLFVGMANARGHHTAAAISPLAYNVIMIGSVWFGAPVIGVWSFLVGVLAAECAQGLTLVPVLGRYLRARPAAEGEVTGQLSHLFWPAALVAFGLSAMMAVDRIFAAQLAPGSVSALAYADRLQSLPALLLGQALAQPFFRRLGIFRAAGLRGAFNRVVELGLRVMMIGGVPLAGLICAFAAPICQLLLQRGNFDAAATVLVAHAVQGYAISIVFLPITPLLLNAALAGRRGAQATWIVLAMVLLNGLLDAAAAPAFGLIGITAATSLVSILMVFALTMLTAPGVILKVGVWRTAWRALVLGGLAFGFGWGTLALFSGADRTWAEAAWLVVLGGGFSAAATAAAGWTFWRREQASLLALRQQVSADAAGVRSL